jgi:bile acid:Na+ symporter, BASS family
VPVDAWALCFSAFQLTIAPVVLGVLIRWKLPRLADAIGACGPTFAVVAFTLVSGGVVAASADAIAAMPLAAAAGVFSGVVQNIIGGLVAAWWKRR